MKVLLICGSPHPQGTTAAALSTVAQILQKEGIETLTLSPCQTPVGGCVGCGGCRDRGKCVMGGPVNEIIARMAECDGLVVGSPVHFAAPAGNLTCLLDRVFCAGKKGPSDPFRLKPAACFVVARRAGTTAALDVLQKYLTVSEMPVVSSHYWCGLHGTDPQTLLSDREGMQALAGLARNLAYFLRCREAGAAAGVPCPVLPTEG